LAMNCGNSLSDRSCKFAVGGDLGEHIFSDRCESNWLGI
jgi:hypothetical protein